MRHTCGVRSDGAIECWGREDAGTFPTDGGWVEDSVGERHTCAIAESGEAVCWGDDDLGHLSVPRA
ncbi:MAG: hypothetical protein GY898_18460 [Proteobacteria bacterium]|nr:hypothetical protein [Pseudomonadota bacterium]